MAACKSSLDSAKALGSQGSGTFFGSELLKTRQNALTMALSFILNNFTNITLSHLEKEYGLNRSTLYRIKKGENVPRGNKYYMEVFVLIIYNRRIVAMTTGNEDLYVKADVVLRDITLVQNGLPTDAERAAFERRKKYSV